MAEAPVEASAMVGILSEILSIAAAFFAIQVVKEIDRRQEERARNLPQAYPHAAAAAGFRTSRVSARDGRKRRG